MPRPSFPAEQKSALGAAPAAVVRLVLGHVAGLVGVGMLVRAGASFRASTFIASLLYGVEPHRASPVDPAEALRDS